MYVLVMLVHALAHVCKVDQGVIQAATRAVCMFHLWLAECAVHTQDIQLQ